MRRLKVSLLLAGILTILGGAFAQAWPPLPDAARERIQLGENAMRMALATYPAQFPDRPLWQEAFRHAEEAISLAPQHPEPYRFQAVAYTLSNWYGPAWERWQAYVARGFPLDSEAMPLFVDTGHRTAFSQYEQGQSEAALRTYLAVLNEVPFDMEANIWAGRILMELGRPEQAIGYWSTVAERDPTNAAAAYWRDFARAQMQWGVEAASEFYEGIRYYEAGSLQQARDHFTRATLANSRYPEAHAWLGRVAFELGNYSDARAHYGRAVELEPGNDTYRWFFEESGRRAGG